MNLQTAATLEMCVEGNCLMVLLNRCEPPILSHSGQLARLTTTYLTY